MKTQWKNVIEIEPDGKSGMMGGAYTLAFVYSNKGNFLVKGYHREVETYLKSLHSKGCKYFVNYTLWSKHPYQGYYPHHIPNHRSIWYFWNRNVSINEPFKLGKKWRKWQVTNYKDINIQFKRFPNRWIPEFENL